MPTTWDQWNTTYTTATTSSSGTNSVSLTWGAWNDDYTTSLTSGTTQSVWYYWTVGTSTDAVLAQVNAIRGVSREPTAEERAEWARAQAEQAARDEQRRREQQEAQERAERLLRECLDAIQQAALDAERAFLVEVKSGRRYRIKRGQAGNVFELDQAGREVSRFCIHPTEFVPDPDVMLAQKLLLETDEAAFRRIANVTRLVA